MGELRSERLALRDCDVADQATGEQKFVYADGPNNLTINVPATPASLTRAISKGLDTKRAPNENQGELPILIVFPGLGGDDLALVGLRRSLKSHASVSCIAYPNGRSILGYQKLFSEIVDDSVDQIRSHIQGKTGIVHLLGYSFGGFVAWEAARILEYSGIRVGSVGLIDPIKIDDSPVSRPSFSDGVRMLARWLACLACHHLPRHCLLPIHWLADTLPSVPRHRLLKFLEKRLRIRAFYEHQLSTHARTATLYLSDAHADRCTALWEPICPNIAVTRIGGDHFSIMDRLYRQSLKTFIAQALSGDESVEASPQSFA